MGLDANDVAIKLLSGVAAILFAVGIYLAARFLKQYLDSINQAQQQSLNALAAGLSTIIGSNSELPSLQMSQKKILPDGQLLEELTFSASGEDSKKAQKNLAYLYKLSRANNKNKVSK